MDEYPTEEDEFELMYGDELDALNDFPDETNTQPAKKFKKSLDFSQCNKENVASTSQNNTYDEFTTIPAEIDAESLPQKNITTKKRSIQELFGEFDELFNENSTKKHKSESDTRASDLALIDHIVQLRKLAKEKTLSQSRVGCLTSSSSIIDIRDKNNYSYNVPTYPFMKMTQPDGSRVYVRFHSEQYEKEETDRIIKEISSSGAFHNSDQLKKQVEELELQTALARSAAEEEHRSIENTSESSLWVDLYKPRKYIELLSDESTNRVLLKWLKLWDKCVFHRNPKVKQSTNKFEREYALNTELDEHGRPFYKVALLAGPPGIGKTTLAHMVAKHLGYNVVEVNASDDRSLDAFRTSLENSTQMQSVLDRDKRPNCMIFDEIDGAPAASINYLVKYITDTQVNKSKKNNKTASNLLKRPIICICNELYAPALRPLRLIAFVINFPQISHVRLAHRLEEIARKQQIKTDIGVMVELAKKSNSDIRSSLSVLQFFKSKKQISLSNVLEVNVGQKDNRSSLFATMDKLFFIKNARDSQNSKSRMEQTLEAVHSYGDYDRLALAVFENYPELMFKNSNLGTTCEALNWFCFNDLIIKKIYSVQDYRLFGYLQYGFAVWNFVFGTRQWQKLKFPDADNQVRKKRLRQQAIINELVSGLKPTVRTFIQPSLFILDVLPFLKVIIVPNFRPINLHLHTKEEKTSLEFVVDVMTDYNLNYVQERAPDGTYAYKLDPNIVEVVHFGNVPNLSYSNKQIIAQQLQTKRIYNENEVVHRERPLVETKKKNHPMMVQTPNKDFFGRPIIPSTSPSSLLQSSDKAYTFKNDIWFQYKEGYSNAVRKTIKILSLK